jgi:hypothetical protein
MRSEPPAAVQVGRGVSVADESDESADTDPTRADEAGGADADPTGGFEWGPALSDAEDKS